jgi:hypothetical protein
MATLANIFNNFIGAGSVVESASRTATRQISDVYTLRAVPNEDVYFFTKRIDNSRVLRQADPMARVRDWKMVGGAGFAAMSLIAMLLPSAYGLMAGYQLSSLKKEQHKLVSERASLELEEARLISAERLQELARIQEFVDPSPERTVYLTPKNDKSLALNRR